MSLKVLIVGAGIAGLFTAIGLTQHGHDVTVLERRKAVNMQDDVEAGSGTTSFLHFVASRSC